MTSRRKLFSDDKTAGLPNTDGGIDAKIIKHTAPRFKTLRSANLSQAGNSTSPRTSALGGGEKGGGAGGRLDL